MDGEELAETLDRNIRFSFLYTPILNARKVEVIGKIFVAAVAFLLPQIGEFGANTRECVAECFLFHKQIIRVFNGEQDDDKCILIVRRIILHLI